MTTSWCRDTVAGVGRQKFHFSPHTCPGISSLSCAWAASFIINWKHRWRFLLSSRSCSRKILYPSGVWWERPIWTQLDRSVGCLAPPSAVCVSSGGGLWDWALTSRDCTLTQNKTELLDTKVESRESQNQLLDGQTPSAWCQETPHTHMLWTFFPSTVLISEEESGPPPSFCPKTFFSQWDTVIETPPLTVGYSYGPKQATDISSMSITYGISICQRKVIKNAEMKKVSILEINMV